MRGLGGGGEGGVEEGGGAIDFQLIVLLRTLILSHLIVFKGIAGMKRKDRLS